MLTQPGSAPSVARTGGLVAGLHRAISPLLLLLLLLLLASPCTAQVGDQPGAWAPEHRKFADGLGTALVGVQIGAETFKTIQAARSGDWRPLKCQVLQLGLGFGVPTVIQIFVHETRPDGSDQRSFPSKHTAAAFASSGWNYSVSLPLAAFIGSSRIAANKHHLKDVLAGAGIGALTQWVCR